MLVVRHGRLHCNSRIRINLFSPPPVYKYYTINFTALIFVMLQHPDLQELLDALLVSLVNLPSLSDGINGLHDSFVAADKYVFLLQ